MNRASWSKEPCGIGPNLRCRSSNDAWLRSASTGLTVSFSVRYAVQARTGSHARTQAYILISVSGTCHHLPLEVRAGLCRVQPSVCGGAAQGRASPSEDLRRRGGAVRWDRRGALRGEYGYTCIWGSAPVHPHLLRESADPARLRYCGRLQPKVMGPLWTT
jgi:hypothetical protein